MDLLQIFTPNVIEKIKIVAPNVILQKTAVYRVANNFISHKKHLHFK